MPLSHHARTLRLAAAMLPAVLLAAACDRSSAQPAGVASAAPSGTTGPLSSSTAAPAASASAAQPATLPAESGKPRGSGVSAFTPLSDVAACKTKSGEIATYQRAGVGLAGRPDGTFAAVWLVEMQNKREAHIAFSGWDGEARQAARARSIGSTSEEGLRVYETGGTWTVTWFNAEGLVYSKPRWETNPPPVAQRLGAVGKEVSENVAIAATPGGALVATAPFGADRNQLGVFLFAPSDPAQPAVQALGVTHYAKQPRRPAVAADPGGYFVAWHEEDGSIKASRFDASGREGSAHVIAAAGPKRERLGLVATRAGAVAVWSEEDTLIARALDERAHPSAEPWIVGKGTWRVLAPTGQGVLVAWVGNDGKAEGQLLLARLSHDGMPSAQGLRITDGAAANVVKDPPALAVAGGRVGLAWTEIMGVGMSTKRALLRVIDAACIP